MLQGRADCARMAPMRGVQASKRRSRGVTGGRVLMILTCCPQHQGQKLSPNYSNVTATYTESITIHPTSGGVAPLYNPRTPSLRTVWRVQSNGPRKCPSLLVCKRTLTVSNLFMTLLLSTIRCAEDRVMRRRTDGPLDSTSQQ